MPEQDQSLEAIALRIHRYLGKLAVYITIRNIEHPQSHQHLTQQNCTSVSQHFKEQHFKNHCQKLCIFHLLAFSYLPDNLGWAMTIKLFTALS